MRALRAADYRGGGGSCVGEALALVGPAHQMLGDAAPAVRERLCVAVADLHNLAGWALFDIGQSHSARVHFSQALALAGKGAEDGLVANIFYRLGRVHLHHGEPARALDYFRSGGLAAASAGAELAAGILAVNQAWAHAMEGSPEQARRSLDRAGDLIGEADAADAPDWARFFTEVDRLAMIGAIHTELALRVSRRHAIIAIPALVDATEHYGDDMARSRSFCLILLATSHLLDADVDRAVDIGLRAVAAAEGLTSTRVRDRLAPLQRCAEQHRPRAGVRELLHRIAAVTADR